MAKNIGGGILEFIIWFFFFYLFLYSINNSVNIAWAAFFLVLIASLGIFASPITRNLSFWNKIVDRIVRKEEEKSKF